MNKRTEIEHRIVEYLRKHKAVTFPQLLDDLSPHFATRGGRAIELLPNCVVWYGLSDELAAALLTLLREQVIDMDDADPLVYWVDGAVLGLPLAKRPPTNGYREPHWVPVVLRLAV